MARVATTSKKLLEMGWRKGLTWVFQHFSYRVICDSLSNIPLTVPMQWLLSFQ